MAAQVAINTESLCLAFVKNYYKLLKSKPEEVYKFYRECSTLSRAEASTGVLATVSTMEGINEQIMSLNANERQVEIKSADAVESHDGGHVVILVTGSVLGLNFAQTFSLARQEIREYFVQTDIFRYIDKVPENGELTGSDQSKEDQAGASQVLQEASSKVVIPAKVGSSAGKTTAAAADLHSGRGGRPHSIYLSGLPPNLSAEQLEAECKKFGAISAEGVQVRTKADGFSFGFVAFVHESSVQKALQASPISIKGKPAYVEIKRGAAHRASGNMHPRGGYIFENNGRGGYYRQNESFRGRQYDDYGRRGYSDGGYQSRGYYNNNAGGTSLHRDQYRRNYHERGRF